MEDRKAKMNRFSQGVSLGDQETHLPAEQGVTPEEVRGVPRMNEAYIEAQTVLRGVPMTGPGMEVEEEYSPPKCAGTTKKGNPCRAYAISKGVFCVGHMTVENK